MLYMTGEQKTIIVLETGNLERQKIVTGRDTRAAHRNHPLRTRSARLRRIAQSRLPALA